MIRRKSPKTILISGECLFAVVTSELQVERRGGIHVRADADDISWGARLITMVPVETSTRYKWGSSEISVC